MRKIIFALFLFFSSLTLANDRYYSLQELTVHEGVLYDNMGELVDGIVALKIMPQYDFFVPYQNGLVADGPLSVTDKTGNVLADYVIKNREVVSGYRVNKGGQQPLSEQEKQTATHTAQVIIDMIPKAIEKYASSSEEEEQTPISIDYEAAELTLREGKLYNKTGKLVDGVVAFRMVPEIDFFVSYQNGVVSDGILLVKDKNGKILSDWQIKDGLVVSGFDVRDGIKFPLEGSALNASTVVAQGVFRKIPELLGSPIEDKKDPLYQAADTGNLKEVEKLVKGGFDVNYVCNDRCQGWTPVMIAAANGHEEVVHYLLENGANPNIPNRFGRTALHYVAKYNFLNIAKDLLVHGANPNLESKNDSANTPVKAALVNGYTDMLILLLTYGGDKNVVVNGISIKNLADEKNDAKLKELLK